MHEFGIPNRRQANKIASSALTGKFTIKKIEFYLRAVFFWKVFIFFCFLNHLETSHLSYQGSVNG